MKINKKEFDVAASISRLFIYPIKSCAGIEVQKAQLLDTGLEWDRNWMVVDEAGEFVTQRELPRMALIEPRLQTEEMTLSAPGMLALQVRLDRVEKPVRARVWDDEVSAFDMGDMAAQWFSDFLGQKLRLVRFDPDHMRWSSMKWTGGAKAPNQFSDGFPILMISETSVDALNLRLKQSGEAAVGVERFRANVILTGLDAHDEDRLDICHFAAADGMAEIRPVKPCARCPIPNIDPVTAISSPTVSDFLQTYRQNDLMNGAITFGMNAIVVSGEGRWLQTGQAVSANYRFD